MAFLRTLREEANKRLADILLALWIGLCTAAVPFVDQLARWTAVETVGQDALARTVMLLLLLLLALFAYVIYLRPRLLFDKATGAFVHKRTGLYYCSKCKFDKKRNVPMREGKDGRGWACPACTTYYQNPAFVEPVVPRARVQERF